MGQTFKAQEPSMEEILASIRRIIADDESKGGAEPPPARPAAAAAPPASPQRPEQDVDAMLSHIDAPPRNQDASDEGVADVLELTESMAAHASQPPPVFRTVESQPDVFFSEEPPEPPPMPPRLPALDTPLMSSSTSEAVDAAFNRLAHTVLSHNARTLEDLVKDMLRPMVKAWLDDNLPGLVERLVRAEIERVSRGR